MATTDIPVSELIINELTQAQYNAIEKKDDELYFITDLLPSQTDQNGKFLTTNGTNTSWGTPSISLSMLTDCVISNPTTGQVLQWNGTNWINTNFTIGSVPSGSIMAYAGQTPPTGYLICDGAAVSRTTYATLFTAIGTTYGTGDGNSTFNLPNFGNNNFSPLFTTYNPVNAASWAPKGIYGGSLPKIEGTIDRVVMYPANGATGCFTMSSSSGTTPGPNSGGPTQRLITFNAARSSNRYSRTDNHIIPSGVLVMGIIKY